MSEMRLVPEWVGEMISAGHEGIPRAARVAALGHILSLAKDGAWDVLDGVLASVPVARLSETSMMTLLRGTYRFREKLVTWHRFREKVAEELVGRGSDAGHLLMGI